MRRILSRLRAKYALPVDSARDIVPVPRLVVRRARVVVVLSLAFNLLLGWAWIHAINQSQWHHAVVARAGELAEASKDLADLYGAQIEDLATAYHLYGQALHMAEGIERNNTYAAYTLKLDQCNRRAERLVALGHRIRERVRRIAGL